MNRTGLARHIRAGVAALVAVALVGCAEESTAPGMTGVSSVSGVLANTTGGGGTFPPHTTQVCKVGSAATFTVTVNGGAPAPLALADGECAVVFTWTPGLYVVSVTENVPAGYVLDSIVKDSTEVRTNITTTLPAITGTATASVLVHEEVDGRLTFFNSPVPPPPPPGGEGCTPGFWKQSQHLDSWPAAYQPDMLFSAVFEDAFPGKTLLQVVSLGGGGLNMLGRHTVAALLNTATGVDYFMGTQGVIDAFNAVFPGGDYNGLGNIFATNNELGCPIN